MATGYAPFLIQMYATAAFDFDQAQNGWLMSEFSIMRSIFLIFMFPRIISLGRRWKSPESSAAEEDTDDTESGEWPTSPGQFDAAPGEQTENEPIKAPHASHDRSLYLFDLVFLRWSLVVDGALTTVAAFATKPWHIYLGKFIVLYPCLDMLTVR